MALLVLLVIGFFIGLVFTQVSKTGSIKPIITTTIIGLVIGLFISTVRVVPAGYVGVVDVFGQVSQKYLLNGINIVNPLAKIKLFSVRTIELQELMNVPSKEGLTITLDVSMLYKLDPNKTVELYKTVGPHYKDVVIIPQARSVVRGVTVGYEAKALYTSEREVLAEKIQESLKNMLLERGVIVEKVLLRSIALPQTVSGAIEQKLKAEQEAERMKFILQKETQEAERKRVEAAGIRDAQAIINQSLTSQYLNYLWINTLNQNPNVIYVATEANMPLFRAINPDEQLLHKKPILSKEQK